MTGGKLRTSLLALALFAGAVSTSHAAETLYDRLGGAPGVAAIASTLIDRAVADPVTGPSFKDAKLDRIKRLLAEQICDLSAGPCRYSGDSMKEVHAGHHITQAQFYRMVAMLRVVLHERDVDQGSTNELLRLLAPTKRDVVEPPNVNVAAPQSAAQSAAQ